MNAQKTGRALTAAAMMALAMTGMTSVCHAAPLVSASDQQVRTLTAGVSQPQMTTPTLEPTVMIGTAMLEEYGGGNPAGRTMILRDGPTARQTSTNAAGKNHS